MKNRLIIFFSSMLLTFFSANAEDHLQITPFSTTAGVAESEYKYFSVEMINEATYTAMQFDLYLPDGMSLGSYPMVLNTDRFPSTAMPPYMIPTPKHVYECSLSTDGVPGHYFIYIYNNNLETISGTSGEILKFYYLTDANMSAGYYPIKIANTVLTVNSTTDTKPATTSTVVTIGTPSSKTFDVKLEGSIPATVVDNIPTDKASYDFSNVDKMEGTFTPTNPNCIQFVKHDSEYAQSLATAGTGNVVDNGVCANLTISDGSDFAIPTQFTATNVTYQRNVSSNWGTICVPYSVSSDATIQYYQFKSMDGSNIIFAATESLEAGQPGVFKRIDENQSSLSFTGSEAVIKSDIAENIVNNLELVGTYTQQTIVVDTEAPSYYFKNNQFCQGVGNFTVPAFRAYFRSTTAASKIFNLVIEDEATGVETVVGNINSDNGEIYSIDGLKLSEAPSKGLYIQGGKKYYAK